MGVGHAGEGFGILEHEGACHRDGGHGPGQGEGGNDDPLVAGRHFLNAVQHHRVVAQGSTGVDDGENRGFLVDGFVVYAAGDAGHFDGVLVAGSADAVYERWLVGKGDHVVGGLKVPY